MIPAGGGACYAKAWAEIAADGRRRWRQRAAHGGEPPHTVRALTNEVGPHSGKMRPDRVRSQMRFRSAPHLVLNTSRYGTAGLPLASWKLPKFWLFSQMA